MSTWYGSPGAGGEGWAEEDDANEGLRKQTPFLSVQCAVGKCEPGDTIVIGRGSHRVAEGFEDSVRRAQSMGVQFIIL